MEVTARSTSSHTATFPPPAEPAERQAAARGMTFMEMLAVLLILAILVAIGLPTVTYIRRAAQEKRAASEIQMLVSALKGYHNTYRRWPGQEACTSDVTHAEGNWLVMAALVPSNAPFVSAELWSDPSDLSDARRVNQAMNPRQLAFIEGIHSNAIAWANAPQEERGSHIDPWRRPYVVAFDLDGDGRVDVRANRTVEGRAASLDCTVPGEGVAVFSWGHNPPHADSPICSWKTRR